MQRILHILLLSLTLSNCKDDKTTTQYNYHKLARYQDLTAIRSYNKLCEVNYLDQDSLLKIYTKILYKRMIYVESFELIDSFLSTLDPYKKNKFYINNIDKRNCSIKHWFIPPSGKIGVPNLEVHYFYKKLSSEKNNEKFILEYLFLEKFFECDSNFEREQLLKSLLNDKSIWLRDSSFIVTKDSCYNENKLTFSNERYY